ncbi:MAG: DUF3224 domain-containing protein [Planctomycetota bacterium]
MKTISGSFDVEVTPVSDGDIPDGVARMKISNKVFKGVLDARSEGVMLAYRGSEGGAGYVAMEVVEGTLDGRRGRFVLQHFGLMSERAEVLRIEVVPGSGTEELSGLHGQMKIVIEAGVHGYVFDYAIGDE